MVNSSGVDPETPTLSRYIGMSVGCRLAPGHMKDFSRAKYSFETHAPKNAPSLMAFLIASGQKIPGRNC